MNVLSRFTLGVMASLGISVPPKDKELRAVAMFWGVLAAALCVFLLAVALIFHVLVAMKQ